MRDPCAEYSGTDNNEFRSTCLHLAILLPLMERWHDELRSHKIFQGAADALEHRDVIVGNTAGLLTGHKFVQIALHMLAANLTGLNRHQDVSGLGERGFVRLDENARSLNGNGINLARVGLECANDVQVSTRADQFS